MSNQRAPALRDLPLDLEGPSLALEDGPLLTDGRLDLHTGEVQWGGPIGLHAHP